MGHDDSRPDRACAPPSPPPLHNQDNYRDYLNKEEEIVEQGRAILKRMVLEPNPVPPPPREAWEAKHDGPTQARKVGMGLFPV
jgi:hypothetical protein